MTRKAFVLLCLEKGRLRGFIFDAVLFYFESKVVSDQVASKWLGTSRPEREEGY